MSLVGRGSRGRRVWAVADERDTYTHIHTYMRTHTRRQIHAINQPTNRTIFYRSRKKYGRKICTIVLSWACWVRQRKTGAGGMEMEMGARGTFPNWREHGSERAGIDRRFVIGMNRINDSQQCSRGPWVTEAIMS